MPEARGDVLPVIVQPLICCTFVERAALGTVGTDFHIIEGFPYLRFHILAAGIKGKGQ